MHPSIERLTLEHLSPVHAMHPNLLFLDTSQHLRPLNLESLALVEELSSDSEQRLLRFGFVAFQEEVSGTFWNEAKSHRKQYRDNVQTTRGDLVTRLVQSGLGGIVNGRAQDGTNTDPRPEKRNEHTSQVRRSDF